MLRFSQYTGLTTAGLGWGLISSREPYNRKLHFYMQIWTWHMHMSWNFKGK